MQLLDGNRLTLLESGAAYFPALEAAIASARHEVYLETYIFADDATGRRIARALAEAAAQGVRTSVLVDGMTVKRYSRGIRDRLLASNVSLGIYRPDISPWNFRRTRLRRLHRKLAVIDGCVAFVGGINVIDDMHTPGHKPPRYDYAVRIEGPLVAEIRAEADRLWRLVALSNFKEWWEAAPPLEQPAVIRLSARGVPRARQLPSSLGHRGRLPRGDRGRERGDHPGERVLLPGRRLPARAHRGGAARRAGGDPAPEAGRVRAPALRVAGAVRPAPRRGRAAVRVRRRASCMRR